MRTVKKSILQDPTYKFQLIQFKGTYHKMGNK